MIGEADAFKAYIGDIKKADGKKNKAPRGLPPSLSPALQDALDEVSLVGIGYNPGRSIKDMNYYSARIRMIASGIYNMVHTRGF